MLGSRVNVSVTQAAAHGFLGIVAAAVCAAASRQATHEEKGSEECFLPDCLSCHPPPPSLNLCGHLAQAPLHALAGREESVHVRTAVCSCVFVFHVHCDHRCCGF